MANSTQYQTLLGFDFGTRSIGIAVGQRITQTARPLSALKAKNGQPNWGLVQKLIGEWRPDALVVGLPLDMEEKETAITDAARQFARRLEGRFNLPVHLIDEKLSSKEAYQRLSTKQRGEKATLDAMAACVILETWLQNQT